MKDRTLKQKISILFATSEVLPFSKTGGLADVSSFLPKSLASLNQEVKVISPYYSDLNINKQLTLLGEVNIDLNGVTNKAQYYSLIENNVNYIFVRCNQYFNRGYYYGCSDDAERFIYFSFAVLHYAELFNLEFDIIHCNDWQTGVIPYLLKNQFKNVKCFANTKSVFTIHNLEFQGKFDTNTSKLIGQENIEYNCLHFGSFNIMKLAIIESDYITTVSNSYAHDILDITYGFTLDGTLRDNSYKLEGIVNGIDYSYYNPEIDTIPNHKYSIANFQDKKLNKEELLQFNKFGNSGPLIIMVSRLSKQKGIDLLIEIIEDVVKNSEASFYFLGNGDKRYELFLDYLASRYTYKVRVYIGYNEAIAHHLYSAADFILLPSLFEPCGISQLIGMKYGVLPICRNIGGLKDTVTSRSDNEELATGFKFEDYNSHEFKNAIFEAINVYKEEGSYLQKMITNAMNYDSSSLNMAQKYINLYQKLLGGI